jgi:2-phospho-L-lactate guanylyltransferase
VIPADCWALVPLRDLARGKERLAAVLDAAARGTLIEAMARDVIAVLLQAGFQPPRVLLVSEDSEVGALAAQLGIGLFRPALARTDPLNASLEQAMDHAQGRGAGAVLLLHADLPLVSPGALRALCAAHAGTPGLPRATLVADRAGEGSNCLLLTPPACMRLCFGAGSRARHRAAAADARVDYREFTEPRLAFDVDLATDLDALVRLAETPDNVCGAHTRAWQLAQPARPRDPLLTG